MNPVLHAAIFILAAIVPGGLLVYFAWRAHVRILKRKRLVDRSGDAGPSPAVAAAAFRNNFPAIASKDSLRMASRRKRLAAYRARRQSKLPKK